MSTNIRDIAKNVGVSVATVSRYLNDSGYVSYETAQRIKKEIERTGYTSNMHAQAIFKKQSKTLGLMIPNILNPFFNEVITYVEDRVVKAGYSLLLCNTSDDKGKEKMHLDMLKRFRVDGIIASRSLCREEYKSLQIPIVSFENNIRDDVPIVTADNYEGGRLAFEHLNSVGCKKLLHIEGPKTFDATVARAKGFVSAAHDYGCNVDVLNFNTDFRYDMAIDSDKELLKKITKYDGIFVFNDISCANIMNGIMTYGVRIPDDIKIMGFDNAMISTMVKPHITTIAQSAQKIADKTVDILLDIIAKKTDYELVNYIDVKLVARESTGLGNKNMN